jgi:hypothetical protein
MRFTGVLTLCLPALAFAFTAGCGGVSEQPPSKAELQQGSLSDVGELYRLYQQENKKPPAKSSDLTKMEVVAPGGAIALKRGEVVVRLGAQLASTEEGPPSGSSDEVLAYYKDVPESGGQVLMLNREVRTMTADEFKAAKMAGTSSSEKDAAADSSKKTKK